MKTNIKVLIFSLVILVASAFIPVQRMVMAASQQVFGWAWSENIGWLQFEPVFGGVFADDTTGDLSGYAWSESLGWVSFEPSDLTGCPSGSCVANLDITTGALSGWAKAISGSSSNWDGWISLRGSSPDYGVDMSLDTGDFSGWAWGSDVVGWLSFSGVTDSGDAYKVYCPGCVGLPTGPSIAVSLSANPSSGAAPLSSTLTAAVTGAATGDIIYKFDCQNDGTYEYSFTSSNPTESRTCDYTANGSYTAKVYAERGGLNDSALVSISVGSGQTSPYYDLSLTGVLYATIIKNSGPVNSSGTASITVEASNFSGDIKLSSNIASISNLAGASVVFSDNLLSPSGSGYESSGISIQNIPETAVPGLYDITIYGNDTGSALGERSATLQLNIESLSPKWKEF